MFRPTHKGVRNRKNLLGKCTYPSQLLPHVQFVPLLSEAVYFSIWIIISMSVLSLATRLQNKKYKDMSGRLNTWSKRGKMNSENTHALPQRWQQLSNSPSFHWAQCHCEAARSDSLQRCTLATHLNIFGVSMSLLESKMSRETSPRSVPLLRQVLQLRMLHD